MSDSTTITVFPSTDIVTYNDTITFQVVPTSDLDNTIVPDSGSEVDTTVSIEQTNIAVTMGNDIASVSVDSGSSLNVTATIDYFNVSIIDAGQAEYLVSVIPPPTPTVTISDETFTVQVFQGDVYFAQNTNVSGVPGQNTVVQTAKFLLVNSNVTEFDIDDTAGTLLSVLINGIDYVEYCSINPAGSGHVIYAVPLNGYTTESGDTVLINWTVA